MRLRSELLDLLHEVIRDQQPDLLPVVKQLTEHCLPSQKTSRLLIRVLLSEVARTGFMETAESVKRGRMLEEIADYLGDANYDTKTGTDDKKKSDC